MVIIAGLVDIGLMIAIVESGRSYSSSISIFAVIAGVSMLRGSVSTAKKVLGSTAFLIGGCLVSPIIFVLLAPPGHVADFFLHEWVAVLTTAVTMSVGLWIYGELIGVLDYGPREWRPLWSIIGGASLGILVAILIVAGRLHAGH